MTAALEIISLANHFMSKPVLKQLWTKSCHALQEYFINRAVASQAWPYNAPVSDNPVTQGWILEGSYALEQLQERYAPRYQQDPRVADPSYQIIAATVIEAVSGYLRALLTMPEYKALVLCGDLGADLNEVHQRILAKLQPVCQMLVAEVGITEVSLSESSLRDAGRRRVFEAVIELQETLLLQRAKDGQLARYKQLLKGWQMYSGDIHNTHIGTGSPMAHLLCSWLLTLPAQDAAAFLAGHSPSAKTAAQLALPEDVWLAIVEADAPVINSKLPPSYVELKRFVEAVLDMPGYRRVTVTTMDKDPVVVNVDLYHRVGSDETSLKKFLQLILDGLRSRAGVVVRAYQTSSVNVFVAESNSFCQVSVHHMYGALLEHGQVFGFGKKAVEQSTTRSVDVNAPRHKQPSLRYFDWPDRAALTRASPPDMEEG